MHDLLYTGMGRESDTKMLAIRTQQGGNTHAMWTGLRNLVGADTRDAAS